MSRLNELIQQYCPDGVEYVRFVDYANVLYGYPFDAAQFTSDNSYIPLIRIRDVLSGKAGTYYTGEYSKDYIIKKGDILVGMDGNFNLGIWDDIDGLLCQRVCKIYTKDETRLLNGFIRHYMKPIFRKIEESTPGGSVKHLSAKAINSIQIPLPPLPVQEEIVRILDNFTELQAELQAGLQAELQKRLQQYNYYRDNLLSFEGRTDVEWKKLGDVASIKTGTKPDLIMTTQTDFEYINAGTTNSGYTNLANSDGDAITTPSRGQGGIGFVGYQRNPFWLGPLCYKIVSIENQLLTKYLYYYLVCHNDVILKLKNTGGVPALNRQDLVGLMIPIPPIMMQQHIISILDRFDTLTTDLSQGLPAEIEARRKQYEYYRDQLLTFKQKA